MDVCTGLQNDGCFQLHRLTGVGRNDGDMGIAAGAEAGVRP